MKKRKFTAVIFDIDGLLIDSEPLWEKGDRELLKSYGITNYDHDKVRQEMLGRGQRECAQIYITRFHLRESVEHFIEKRWKSLYALLDRNIMLMPGAKSLIAKLRKKNIILALATGGHRREKAQEILKKTSLLDVFTIVVSGLDVMRSKPFPDIYRLAAQVLGVEPLQCLVLEDSPNGVVAAKRAGMLVYGVNKDAAIREKLKEAGADKVFSSLAEVKV